METTEKNKELENESAELRENVSKLVIGLCYVSIALQINGFLIYQLWKWIIVPTYGVDPITLWQGLGLGVFVTLFRVKVPSLKKRKKRATVAEYRNGIRHSFEKLVIFLLIGWLVSFFV